MRSSAATLFAAQLAETSTVTGVFSLGAGGHFLGIFARSYLDQLDRFTEGYLEMQPGVFLVSGFTEAVGRANVSVDDEVVGI